MLQLGIFASGRGTNFEAIAAAAETGRLSARMRLLITNNKEAGALEIAKEYGIPAAVIAKDDFQEREAFIDALLSLLREHEVDFIALAGYMKKIPEEIVAAYRNRIVNIHPALLPAFGGKGMYGVHVHEAVIEAGCKVTGVTVHLVDEVYDRGAIVAQRCVPVDDGDTAETLASRVLKIEHALYPEALQLFAAGRVRIAGNKTVVE